MADDTEARQQGFLDWLVRLATDCNQEGPGYERPALVEVGDYWIPVDEVLASLRYCADPLPAAAVRLVYAVLGDDESSSPMSYGEAVEVLSPEGR